MKIDFLTVIPESGYFEEFHFGESFSDSLWVKFEITEDNHWLGCFSKSYSTSFNKVLFNVDNNTCCVVAGGKAYLIDIETRKIIFETEEHPLIVSAAQSIHPNLYYLGTYYNVFVLNETGLIKEIEPKFMVDGIYLEYQDGNKMVGKVETAENQYSSQLNISIDIDNLEFDPLFLKSKNNFIKRLFGN